MNSSKYDDQGKTQITAKNVTNLMYGFHSNLKDSEVKTLIDAKVDIQFNSKELTKGNLGNSGPVAGKGDKMHWVVNLDLKQVNGSMKALMESVVHELDHGVYFVQGAGRSISNWNRLTIDSSHASSQYKLYMNKGDRGAANWWYQQYRATPVESRAFATSAELWKEQGW